MTREQFENQILPISRNLYRYAFRFLASVEEAEDTVQETFIKLWKMRNNLDKYRSVEALGMTICRNLCLDLLRKRGREISDESAGYNIQSSIDPERALEGKEIVARVTQIVEALPENYRTAMKMKDIEGHDYEFISSVMGVSVNLLRVNISRARKIVRDKLKEIYYAPAGTKNPS